MRVLFITGEFPPMQGGVGDYTRELGLALHSSGWQVQIVTSTRAGPVADLVVYATVERWNWSSWGAILDLVRGQWPNVVHIQYQAAAYDMHPAINLLPRRLHRLGANRPRIVVTFHDLKVPYLFPKAGPLRRWVVNELARSSDAAITTNREDYETLAWELGAGAPSPSPAPVLSLIPIGSNISPRLPEAFDRSVWRARWSAGPDNVLLCFFGFVNDRKGVDTLLHALRLIVTDPNRSVNPHLLFIGGQIGASDPTNIAYLAHIRTLIPELELQDHVHWSGYVPTEEVSANFSAADICVLPFRDGVSFLHGTFHAALAHGMPIITTQPRVELPELVHGGNIYLVPQEDPRALAQAIVHLAASPDLRRSLGQGARTLSERFHWDKIAADTLDLYRTIGVGD